MKIYLAAPWIYRKEARGVRDRLVAEGFSIISRWLDFDATKYDEDEHSIQQREAINDIEDLNRADFLVVLNLVKSEGKAWEQGYAFARGLHTIVVGPRFNVFQHIERAFTMVSSVDEAIAKLRALEQ